MVFILASHAMNTFVLHGLRLGAMKPISVTAAATHDPPKIGMKSSSPFEKAGVELKKQLAKCVGHPALVAAVQKMPPTKNVDSSAENI